MTLLNTFKSSVAALALGAALVATAKAAEPITLQLSWKAQVEFAGFYEAQEKKYYAACGVDMNLRAGAPGIDTAQLLAAGAVDAALVAQNDGVIRMNIAGFPARAVMASVQKFATILMVHEESGTKKMEDLKGKPILLSQGNRATVWPYLKNKYGFTDDQLRAYNGQLALWMSEKDAAQQGVVTQEPYRVMVQTGKMPPYFLVSDTGYNPYTVVVAVSQKLIDEKPAAVQCIVDATRKGWEDFMKDPSVAMAAIQKANPENTNDLMNFTYKTLKDNAMIENADTAKYGIGAITEARWKAHFDMLVANGLVPASFDYKQSYTTQFLKKPTQ